MKKRILIFVSFIMIFALCLMMSTVAFAADVTNPVAAPVSFDTPDVSATIVLPDININLEAAVGAFLAMLVLATVIETLAELIKAALPNSLPKWTWLCITSLIGIGLCILFKVDFFAAIGFSGGVVALIVGEIFTGIFVGAGSSFIHNLIDKMYAVKTSLNLNTSANATANSVPAPDSTAPVENSNIQP